jgi:hypothetical protein
MATLFCVMLQVRDYKVWDWSIHRRVHWAHFTVRKGEQSFANSADIQSINPSTPSLFKAKLSPHAKSSKAKPAEEEEIDTTPKKLEWKLTPELIAGVRYAETRLSDLICQNDSQALEFTGYGSGFMKRHGFSPDAFVQMAFQAAYYGLYGRVDSTYEPAMTKQFLHGRTEAIRTVQPESVAFVKVGSSRRPHWRQDVLLRVSVPHWEDQCATQSVQAPYRTHEGV